MHKLLLISLILFCSPVLGIAAENENSSKADGGSTTSGLAGIAIIAGGGYLLYKRKRGKVQSREIGLTAAKKLSGSARPGGIFAEEFFSVPLEQSLAKIRKRAVEKQMDETATREAVKACLTPIALKALEDGVLSVEEENKMESLIAAFGISASEISYDVRKLLAKGALIRDLLEGEVNPRLKREDLPYKPFKNEIPIWGFQNMRIAEIRTVSQFEGGSKGVSLRIAKGVYWRVGKVPAQRVSSTQVKDIGTGDVYISSHHLYYQAGLASKRIRHEKIFSVTPYADSVVVYMDGSTVRPLVVYTDDPWFMANILQNAQNWM